MSIHRVRHGLCIGFLGKMRSGKSLSMLELGLKIAAYREYGIIANFPLSLQGIYQYAEYLKSDFLKRACDDNLIFSLPSDTDRDLLFRYPYKVILYDEMGALFNARDWKNNTKKDNFLKYLAQIGHRYCCLLYTAQFAEQVDSVVRRLSDYIGQCSGLSVYRKNFKLHQNKGDINKIHIHHLIYRNCTFMDGHLYWSWVESDDRFKKPLGNIFKRCGSLGGFLGKNEKLLFNCYESHGMVGSSVRRTIPIIKSPLYSRLPLDYYVKNAKWLVDGAICPITRRIFERNPNYSLDKFNSPYWRFRELGFNHDYLFDENFVNPAAARGEYKKENNVKFNGRSRSHNNGHFHDLTEDLSLDFYNN